VSGFGWNYIDGTGESVGTSQRFDDRESAEDWMGQAWEGLSDVGIEHVVLFDHSREKMVYRMGLQAE
jgi:hypothetical protein